jgi:cell wall-associated NlpC family hydrolase
MHRSAWNVLALLWLALAAPVFAQPGAAVDVPVIELDPAVKPSPRGPAAEVVVRGLSFLGIPYRWGGDTRASGLDCSGLVNKVYLEAAGIALPRTTRELAQSGRQVARKELKAGDLVFFNTLRRPFSHVGIYLGGGRFLHAPSKGGKVRVEQLAERYWSKRFNGARRIIPAPTQLTANDPAAYAPDQAPGLQRSH